MMKIKTLILIAVAVLFSVESKVSGTPVSETENGVKNQTFALSKFSPRFEWLNFHHWWSYPSISSVTSLFQNDEKVETKEYKEAPVKKSATLESMQQDIIAMLRKINNDISAVAAASSCTNRKPEKGSEELISPAKLVTEKPKVQSLSTNKNEESVSSKVVLVEDAKKSVEIEKPQISLTHVIPSLSSDDKNNRENFNADVTSTQEAAGQTSTTGARLEVTPEVTETDIIVRNISHV